MKITPTQLMGKITGDINKSQKLKKLYKPGKDIDKYVFQQQNGNTMTVSINHSKNMSYGDWVSFTVVNDKKGNLVRLMESNGKTITIVE